MLSLAPCFWEAACCQGDLPRVLWEERGKERLQAPHCWHPRIQDQIGRALTVSLTETVISPRNWVSGTTLTAKGSFYSILWLAFWMWRAAAGCTKGAGKNKISDLHGVLAQMSHWCFISSMTRWRVEKGGSWETRDDTCWGERGSAIPSCKEWVKSMWQSHICFLIMCHLLLESWIVRVLLRQRDCRITEGESCRT